MHQALLVPIPARGAGSFRMGDKAGGRLIS